MSLVDSSATRIDDDIVGTYFVRAGWSTDSKRFAYYSYEPGQANVRLSILDLAAKSRTRYGVAQSSNAATPRHHFPHALADVLWNGENAVISIGQDGAAVLDANSGDLRQEAFSTRAVAAALSPPVAGAAVAAVLSRNPNTLLSTISRVDGSANATRLHSGQIAVTYSTLACSAMCETIAFAAEAAHEPERLFVLRSGVLTPLPGMNDTYPRRKMGELRRLQWTSPTGNVMYGTLVMPPPGVSKAPYPMIVDSYGALESQVAFRFGSSDDFNAQVFAAEGYVVAMLDSEPTQPNSPVRHRVLSMAPGIEALVSEGLVDPKRVAVYGHSYGGQHAVGFLVESSLFKTAIIQSTVYVDQMMVFGRLDRGGSATNAESLAAEMGADPWMARDRYIANSPIYDIDRVNATVLLVHGSADPWRPWGAEQFFAALRHLGKPAVYRLYVGAGHIFRDPRYRRDLYQQMIEWLRTKL